MMVKVSHNDCWQVMVVHVVMAITIGVRLVSWGHGDGQGNVAAFQMVVFMGW